MHLPLNVVIVLLAFAVICLLTIMLLRRLQRVRAPYSPDLVSDVSLERYQAFGRLFSSEDLRFLRSQAGFKRALERRFVRDRRRIARMYLSEMRHDFDRLCRGARALAASSPECGSELLAAATREWFVFYSGFARLHVMLALDAIGVRLPALPKVAESLSRIQSGIRAVTAR